MGIRWSDPGAKVEGVDAQQQVHISLRGRVQLSVVDTEIYGPVFPVTKIFLLEKNPGMNEGPMMPLLNIEPHPLWPAFLQVQIATDRW